MLALVLILTPLTWWWASSLYPGSYNVMNMGYRDGGGGPTGATDMAGMPGRSVADLTVGTDRRADVVVTLTARQEAFTLGGGRRVSGYTLNGTSPGPTITATQGQLLEVHLRNQSVPGGVTLHWHGYDVPNADDGVAGVTQDAVPVGGEFVYRFMLGQAGTYWYHSHQVSDQQVIGGMLGALVVRPATSDGTFATDELVLIHSYDGRRTVNGADGDTRIAAAPGSRVRLRLINTDYGPMSVWVTGAPVLLWAVDGTDEHGPQPVSGQSVQVTAGGRDDLAVTMPDDGSAVRVVLGGAPTLILGSGAVPAPGPQPKQAVDLLHYGTPTPTALSTAAPTRSFSYAIGRRFGFSDGVPGLWWTINGHQFPDIPMFVVSAGDVVHMHITNSSGDVHPMHLHGHHALVLARNGVTASGSPWWVDSLNVNDGESYVIAFLADNPGIWMDHCHNLTHAAQGLIAHLMYTGVSEPYTVGGASGNEPE